MLGLEQLCPQNATQSPVLTPTTKAGTDLMETTPSGLNGVTEAVSGFAGMTDSVVVCLMRMYMLEIPAYLRDSLRSHVVNLFLRFFLILLVDPLLVGTRGDVGHPVLIVEIPPDGLADARLEGLGGFPTQLPVDLGGVDRVAAVVPGSIGNVGDLFPVALPIGTGGKFVQNGAQGVDHVEIRLFVPSSDVVGLPHPAGLEDATDGGSMVLHEEPVAHLLTVAVDGERLAGEGVMDDQRDELLGKVVGAVVVGAVRGQDGQAVGVVIGADKVVRSGLAGGIRTIRLVLLGLGEGGIGRSQRSVDLVGGDMEEAKGLLVDFIEIVPVGSCGLEEGEGPDDVGLNEFGRAMDRTIHMGLGGKVDDGTGSVLDKELGNQFGITDVSADKDIPGIALQRGKVLEVARVGQLVEVDDGVFLKGDPVENKVRADESGTAGNEDCGHDGEAFRPETIRLLAKREAYRG